MRYFGIAAIIAGMLFALSHADAQVPGGSGCGAPGLPNCQIIGVAGGQPVPVTGTFSATLGGFAPNGNYTTLSVPSGSSSASTALPAGTVVLFQNTGSNTASVNLAAGAASATATQIQVPANSWIALTVGANDHFAAYGVGGTSSLVLTGGAGLPTGAGGGSSGGGGGGAVTVADGADVAQGAVADAAYTSGSGTIVSILKGVFAKLGTIVTNLGSPFQAGGSIGNTAFVANAGTNLNTSALTLEAGHIATVDTSTAAINTATGAQANSTWDGSSAASGISIWRYIGVKLEAIRALLAGTLTVSGTVTANAGTPLNGTSTDDSGTVTTGNTYQSIIAAGSGARKGCLVQNPPTATEALNVRIGATTVFYLSPGQALACASGPLVVQDQIFVTAATTSHAFSANNQ